MVFSNSICSIFRTSTICSDRIEKLKKESKILIAAMLIYFINRLIKNYIEIPIIGYLIKCHVNDFLGGIVFCAYVNVILIWGKRREIKKYYQTFIMILTVGLIWEYVFPIFLKYSVSDVFDVLSYVLGGTVYYFIKKRGRKNE